MLWPVPPTSYNIMETLAVSYISTLKVFSHVLPINNTLANTHKYLGAIIRKQVTCWKSPWSKHLVSSSRPRGACLPFFPCGCKSDYIIPSVHQRFLTSTRLSCQLTSSCSLTHALIRSYCEGKKRGPFPSVQGTAVGLLLCCARLAVTGRPRVQHLHCVQKISIPEVKLCLLAVMELRPFYRFVSLNGALRSFRLSTMQHKANVNVSQPFK